MSNPLAKLLRLVPAGTHLVIGGTVVLGLASYIQIAVAGHALAGAPRAGVSELWSLVMTVSTGLFFPIEQELTRVVAARVVRHQGVAPVLRRASLLTLGMLVVICGALALTAGPVADTFFGGNRSMVWAFGGSLVGMALVYLSRGILAGLGLFQSYGLSLALDGGLRIILAGGLYLAGSHSALAYGLVLTVAPLFAMACTVRPALRGCRPGPLMPWNELFQNLAMMICAQVLAQFVVNAAVITTAVVATDPQVTFALLSAGVLCRIPLFVFGSLQPTLMTGLSTTATSGDRVGFRKMLLRTCAVLAGLGVLGAVPAVCVGSWLIHTFLGAPDVLGPMDFFWFSFGTMCYMLAMVLGQALMALGRHRWQMVCWLLGTAALIGVTVLPGPVTERVEVAYAVSSLVTAVSMLLILLRGVTKNSSGPTAEGTAAASALENA